MMKISGGEAAKYKLSSKRKERKKLSSRRPYPVSFFNRLTSTFFVYFIKKQLKLFNVNKREIQCEGVRCGWGTTVRFFCVLCQCEPKGQRVPIFNCIRFYLLFCIKFRTWGVSEDRIRVASGGTGNSLDAVRIPASDPGAGPPSYIAI